jgi:hypothetical protein
VLWSNQVSKKFGFRTHVNGASVSSWSNDEVPAGGSAQPVGKGFSDDHLNMKISSNGTIFAAVKTSYDKAGYPVLMLLVRRPTGVWDRAYEVAQIGTRPIVLLNESKNKLRVAYSGAINGSDIFYKESAISSIAFGRQFMLFSGINNNVTSTHQNFTTEIAILASNEVQTVSLVASDVGGISAPGVTGEPVALNSIVAAASQPAPVEMALTNQQELLAYPNPFNASATLSFALPADGDYSLTLYDSRQVAMVYQKQGKAKAGELNTIEVDGVQLPRGIYFARLQTGTGTKTLRLMLNR